MIFLSDFEARRILRGALFAAVVFVCAFMLFGCGLPEKGEAAITKQLVLSDGMARSIESGVEIVDPVTGQVLGHRRVTFDELVHYVYALRFGYYALEHAAGMTDVAPDPEHLGPPGGWVVAPVGSTSGGR